MIVSDISVCADMSGCVLKCVCECPCVVSVKVGV